MMEASEKLYNVKILKNFELYLRRQLDWKQNQIEELFESCNSDVSFLESDDNWFDQEFADTFYHAVVQLTGDVDIAYKVGRFTPSEIAQGISGKIVQGLLSPQVAFRNIQKVGGLYTKGSYYEAIMIKRGRAIIRSHANQNCKEKFYQCRNRLGMVETIPAFFNHTTLSVNHDICYHKGGPYCEYEIIWKESWKYSSYIFTLLIGILAAFASSFFTHDRGTIASITVASAFLIQVFFQRKNAEKMATLLRKHNNALTDSVSVLNRRHEETILVRDIMKATTQMRPIEELAQAAAELIKNKMSYDRVLVLLVDHGRAVLEVKASAGYQGELRELVSQAEFRIRNDNSSGFFVNVVNTGKPIFVRDGKKKLHQLSPRSQTLMKMLGTEAFIAVPIIFEGESLGVLAVENETLENPLTNNDLELLQSVADHLAVSITNSISYQKTAESLRLAKKLESQERNTRELFQKYVPGELLDQPNHLNQSLIQVKKDTFSVMFVDIFNYSTISQNLPSEEVVNILNTYVEEINEIVCRRFGRINKIIGDGLLIYFSGGPENCLRAGHEILQKMKTINERLTANRYSSIEIGIGAHRGECIIGNIGYQERLDYTLIGDTVNTASRVEGYTREIGPNSMCFSASLLPEPGKFEFKPCGEVSLKGLQQPVEIYQLLINDKTQKAAA